MVVIRATATTNSAVNTPKTKVSSDSPTWINDESESEQSPAYRQQRLAEKMEAANTKGQQQNNPTPPTESLLDQKQQKLQAIMSGQPMLQNNTSSQSHNKQGDLTNEQTDDKENTSMSSLQSVGDDKTVVALNSSPPFNGTKDIDAPNLQSTTTEKEEMNYDG